MVDGRERLPAVAVPVDPMRDPYSVDLSSLDAGTSRDTMRGCLDRIARLINPGATSGAGQPWHLLRYEHTTRVRALLVSRWAATARSWPLPTCPSTWSRCAAC